MAETLNNQQYDQAKDLLEASLAERETAVAAHDLGVIFHRQGDNEQAIKCFERAITIDPTYTASYINAAEVFLQDGFPLHVLDVYARAITAIPDDIALKEKFISLSRSCKFMLFNPRFKTLFIACMQTPGTDCSLMGPAWFSLIKHDPAFKKIFKLLGRKKNLRLLNKSPVPQELLDPYFILALKKQVRICNPDFECFITNLRHLLLNLLETGNPSLLGDDFVTLAEALAHYCFHVEYIFDTSEEEKQKINSLRDSASSEDALATLACYMPLHQLDKAKTLESKFSSSAIADLIKIQITDHNRQQEIKKTIESLTETTDGVSAEVKAQYEESPYPCWNSYSKSMYSKSIEGPLSGKKAKILVAGCGTGHEAVELGHVFPDAEVLAIDLSYTSLAYGISKAQDFAIRNVDFKQADILKLGSLDQKFDYIASSGVLHHMEDPQAGWDVVSGLLKPGGIMRLCLYSRLGRQSIIKARDIIRKKGYSNSADDIRRFRKDAKKLLGRKTYKTVTSYADYYSLSECRDLLFHVQEHQLNLPEIKKWLDSAGMEFLGFFNADDSIRKYRQLFPQDPAATNLDLWAAYEEKNPDTFASMYRMWLKKR